MRPAARTRAVPACQDALRVRPNDVRIAFQLGLSLEKAAAIASAEKPRASIRSPPSKAMKFLHRGSYDEIDSTYNSIVAFLAEKGLESQNRFIEQYLADTTEPDDANLEALKSRFV